MRRFLLLAGLAGLASCAQPPVAVPYDPRVILTPAVAPLGFSPPSVTASRDGRMQVTINVSNPLGGDFPLRIQTDWLSDAGRPISSLQSRPTQLLVPRSGAAIITADAPNSRVRDFRMQIDLDSP